MKTQASLSCLLALVLATTIASTGDAMAQKARKITIGVIVDESAAAAEPMVAAIKTAVIELAGTRYDIGFPPDKLIAGEFSRSKIAAGVDRLLADPEVTIVFALGPLASHNVGQRKNLPKPVIAPFIIDRKLQNMPFDKGTSGRRNFNYLDWPWSVERDLEVFKEVAAPKKVVFLVPQYLLDAVPELADQVTAAASEAGFAMGTVAVGEALESVLAALPGDIDGVYFAPPTQLAPNDADQLIAELTRRRIATFALGSAFAVDKGALVARQPKESLGRIARRVALHTQRIIDGQDAGELSVALQLPERITINMTTARTIGLSLTWQVLAGAELIALERDEGERKINLKQVMNEALAGNVNVKALEQVVAAGRASVRTARASLLPQLDIASNGRVIDRDRAEASLGNAPEVYASGEVNLTQVIYAEGAWARYTAEQHLQQSRQYQLVQGQWDIIAEVGVAYLNVLRAKSGQRIRHENLKLTRANLDLARIRVDAGISSRADVHRWEVQIANDRKALIEAAAQRSLAEIDLQRILHRPPEESFVTEEESLPATSDDSIAQFVNDPQAFRWIREFLIAEAIELSPEIKQFDAAIAAQERALASAKRALYSPTVALSANATQRLYKGGAGSEPLMMSSADSLEWFVGLSLSIPLYQGGQRYGEIDRNSAELMRLMRERDGVRDQIAQRAASQLHLARASLAGIFLSKAAAEAAKKNYDLVARSYAEGAVRVVDLLDAQNAWVSAEQLAADARYNFLIDWINVQRAIGRFTLLMTREELLDLRSRANTYVEQRRAELERSRR